MRTRLTDAPCSTAANRGKKYSNLAASPSTCPSPSPSCAQRKTSSQVGPFLPGGHLGRASSPCAPLWNATGGGWAVALPFLQSGGPPPEWRGMHQGSERSAPHRAQHESCARPGHVLSGRRAMHHGRRRAPAPRAPHGREAAAPAPLTCSAGGSAKRRRSSVLIQHTSLSAVYASLRGPGG